MNISFVIPAYNEEKKLKFCLESIIREAAGKALEYEIIVVNNASTDRTKEAALSIPNVRVVYEPRKSLILARQAGFLASSGDLVANIDADTIMPKGWLNKVTEFFSQNSKLVCLSGPHIAYDMPKWFRAGAKVYYWLVYALYLLNRFVFRLGSMVQGGNFVVKRAALQKIGGFNMNYDFYGEDADIARRINKVGKVIFTLKLPIFASGRRIKAEGIFKTPMLYGLNYLWTIFFHRPFSKKSADIRMQA